MTIAENIATMYAELDKRYNAFPHLVFAVRDLLDVATDDAHAAHRIELRRRARLLLVSLGELPACQHVGARITWRGWECAACGEHFPPDLSPAHATMPACVNGKLHVWINGELGCHWCGIPLPIAGGDDSLSPAHAWPDISEFLKKKTP